MPCLFVLVLLNTGEVSLMKSAEMNCAPMRACYSFRKFHPSENSILLRAQAKCAGAPS